MNEQGVRQVILARAIESADSERQVLSDDDRKYASRRANELAQWEAADKKSELTPALFLQKRAEQLLKKIEERNPAFVKFAAPRSWLLLSGVALPTMAFLVGVFVDRIADPHRLDLLSPPLLLIILWNLAIYVALLLGPFIPAIRTRRVDKGLLGRLTTFVAVRPRKIPQALAEALTKFIVEWADVSAPLTSVRIKRILHFSSACFAAGAVVSLYARGLVSEYRAGWESTYLNADQVYAIQSMLFKPATLVFQMPGFSVADVHALKSAYSISKEVGAQWGHLYAGTLILLVVMPRLALAFIAGWSERKLGNNLPLDLSQPYFRKLTESVGPTVSTVLKVVPYSFTLDEVRSAGLATVAKLLFGEQSRVMLRPSTPYGEESQDASVGVRSDGTNPIYTVALFNLSATPERENHGAFLDQFLTAGTRNFSAMIDESGYLERIGSQAGGEGRVRERIALWRQFCEMHSVPSAIVNLITPLARKSDIEGGLVYSGQAK